MAQEKTRNYNFQEFLKEQNRRTNQSFKTLIAKGYAPFQKEFQELCPEINNSGRQLHGDNAYKLLNAKMYFSPGTEDPRWFSDKFIDAHNKRVDLVGEKEAGSRWTIKPGAKAITIMLVSQKLDESKNVITDLNGNPIKDYQFPKMYCAAQIEGLPPYEKKKENVLTGDVVEQMKSDLASKMEKASSAQEKASIAMTQAYLAMKTGEKFTPPPFNREEAKEVADALMKDATKPNFKNMAYRAEVYVDNKTKAIRREAYRQNAMTPEEKERDAQRLLRKDELNKLAASNEKGVEAEYARTYLAIKESGEKSVDKNGKERPLRNHQIDAKAYVALVDKGFEPQAIESALTNRSINALYSETYAKDIGKSVSQFVGKIQEAKQAKAEEPTKAKSTKGRKSKAKEGQEMSLGMSAA